LCDTREDTVTSEIGFRPKHSEDLNFIKSGSGLLRRLSRGEGGKGDEVMSMANEVVVGEDLEARGVSGPVWQRADTGIR
jgi:hypothetical protein